MTKWKFRITIISGFVVVLAVGWLALAFNEAACELRHTPGACLASQPSCEPVDTGSLCMVGINKWIHFPKKHVELGMPVTSAIDAVAIAKLICDKPDIPHPLVHWHAQWAPNAMPQGAWFVQAIYLDPRFNNFPISYVVTVPQNGRPDRCINAIS